MEVVALENIFLAATRFITGSCWINQLRDTQTLEEVRAVLMKLGFQQTIVGCAALGYAALDEPSKEKKKNAK